MKRCVFAGTFDPPTLGHKDIVLKCLELFDEVIVAILINPNKRPLFSEEARLAMLRKVFAQYKNVRVLSYDGLTVDLLRRENAKFYVRGIRNGTDYDYEAQLNYINMDMYKEMITVFLPTRQEFLHISSSLVKDALRFNKNVDKYVPEEIRGDLKKYMQEAGKNV
ncbi:MAG TPA: pantetheine-phosphate adenylyltransferase [Candidatus Borkfalkia excrementipullorum]|nr:pantetheine-phosphate adenylyltransferase [Candidatus Borkfalkia excrementipullorum]